jgi:hypothetical protein
MAAARGGTRVLTLTHCEVDSLTQGGIEADFQSLEPLAVSLAGRHSDASLWRITAPAGTDDDPFKDGFQL